jgi:hypothetical protein
VTLDEQGARAELRRAAGRHQARGTAADHDEIIVRTVHRPHFDPERLPASMADLPFDTGRTGYSLPTRGRETSRD